MSNSVLGFIGGGNMTRAIAGGLIASGYESSSILIGEPSADQRQALSRAFPGSTISADNADVVTKSNCIVLAVKPQVLNAVCEDMAETVQRVKPLVISIAAGIRCEDIDNWLGGNLAIVRVMPNQPALLRKGVSGIFANARVGEDARIQANAIMSAVGKVVHVPNEIDIDAVTAVSGSGPAYFFLLIDMLLKSGEELGLDAEAAATLAVETAVGAAALASHSVDPMGTQISRVRSPGGTTAAALDVLDAHGVRAIFGMALKAARDRAIELADQAHQGGQD